MDNNRILLINATPAENDQGTLLCTDMSLALLYLAGALKRARFEVDVFDGASVQTLGGPVELAERLKLAEALILEKLKRHQPFMVGISCLFSGQTGRMAALAKMVKDFNPDILVAVGGMPPTIFSREIQAAVPQIDFVLLGEGERSLPELALALKNNRELRQVQGLTFRGRDGQIIHQPQKEFIKDVDSIAPPAYDMLDFQEYRMDASRWHNPKGLNQEIPIPLITSRSCPYRCNFCAMYLVMGDRFRPRSAELVLDELDYLYHEKGGRYFNIMDDNFTLNKKRALDICRGIVKRGLNIQFRTTNGLNLNSLDDELIDALAEAGLIWTGLAIESGSEYIRNQVMGKHLSEAKIKSVTRAFKRHHQILLYGFFIIGMPEETRQTLQETYRLIAELELDTFSTVFPIPFPGTTLYEQCLKRGLLPDGPITWDRTNIFAAPRNPAPAMIIVPEALLPAELFEFKSKFDLLKKETMSGRYQKMVD